VPGGVQGLDRYAYSYNNPVKYIDPSGHKVCHWGNPDKACNTYSDDEYQLDRQIEKPNDECKQNPQCVKAYLTYKALVLQLHYIPSEPEMIYMTIGSEYWGYVDKPYQTSSHVTPRSVGQEAVAREYYQFCGTDGCTGSEIYQFMSGYEQWSGKVTNDKTTAYSRADAMLGFLNNSYAGTGSQLAGDISQILNHERDTIAVQQGWIYGEQPNEPWQFFSGPMPANISLGFGQGDYAILAVNVGDYYEFMFTYYQTNNK
jgi:hypothetical protein